MTLYHFDLRRQQVLDHLCAQLLKNSLPFSGRCALTLDSQLSNLQEVYKQPNLLTHPLLPPYSLTQVQALEAENGVRFPAILRLYLLNISRQQAITDQRSCFVSERKQSSGSELYIELNISYAGPNSRAPALLTLKGQHRGFVGINDRWNSIYHCLLQPGPEDANCNNYRCKRSGRSNRQPTGHVSLWALPMPSRVICKVKSGNVSFCHCLWGQGIIIFHKINVNEGMMACAGRKSCIGYISFDQQSILKILHQQFCESYRW